MMVERGERIKELLKGVPSHEEFVAQIRERQAEDE